MRSRFSLSVAMAVLCSFIAAPAAAQNAAGQKGIGGVTQVAEDWLKGQRRALIVGISDYANLVPKDKDPHAYAKRWVRSVTEECLDHPILFGMPSLRRALSSYRAFLNNLSPHQGLGNEILARAAGDQARRADVKSLGELKTNCTEFLGRLLKSYSVAA